MKRIALMVFTLIGSASLFGYWSIGQFNQAFDNLSSSNLAIVSSSSAYPSFRPHNTELASTSPETDGELATSTDSEVTLTTSTSSGQATSTDPELSLTFPQSNVQVYIGCIYPISWQPTSIISSLETALIDAGTREAVGPKTGGLAKENIIEKKQQNLNWKVGFVWPGTYYIKISKINGIDTETRSKAFMINKMPDGISATEQADTCKKSGGSF